jgi:hypothetical protein
LSAEIFLERPKKVLREARKIACGNPVNYVWRARHDFTQFSLATNVAFRQNPASRLSRHFISFPCGRMQYGAQRDSTASLNEITKISSAG